MDISKKHRISTQLFLFGVSVCMIMAFRYAKINFVSNSLWAEDGEAFYPQVFQFGISSLIQPYAGYLHLFPRVFAAIASTVSAPLIPYVFFAGWLCAIFVLYWTATKAMAGRRYAAALGFAIPLIALLQPHSGETFLSLTNAQWWLGSALAIIASMPWAFSNRAMPLAAVLSLTGPFSILVLPVAAVQCIRHKRYALLATIAIGAAVQIAVLMNNPRESQALDTNIEHWIACLVTFFTFGSDSLVVRVASSVFWIGLLATMSRPAKGSWPLIVCAGAAFAAALYSLKGMPHALSPVFNGGRYFVIPYTLIIIAFINNAYRGTMLNLITAAALFCVLAFSLHTINQAETGYRAYAKFSAFEKSLRIPIAPINPNTNGMGLRIANPQPKPGITIAEVQIAPGMTKIAESICADSRNIGIAVSLFLERGEYVAIKWRAEGDAEFKTVSRYYDAGEARAQIVLTKSKMPVDLYIEVTGTSSNASTDKQVIACF